MKRRGSYLLIAALIGASTILKAQDFEVAPVVLNFTAEPGEIQSKTLTITNHSNTRQAFLIQMTDFITDSISGERKVVPAGTSKRSCAQYLTLKPNFFSLNPNEQKIIEVLMKVPMNENGTKWTHLFVKTTEEQTAGGVDKEVATGVVVTPRIGVRVTQSPKSNENYRAKISNFREIEPNENGERVFTVDIENTGDKIIEPKIYLLVSNLATATEKKLSPTRLTMLPGDKKTINLTLSGNFGPGEYILAAILDYGHNTALEGVQKEIVIK